MTVIALFRRPIDCRSFLATMLFLFLALCVVLPAQSSWKCSPPETSCKTVYVVHDSWHAAMVLRAEDVSPETIPELADFSGAKFVEFSWGDKDYFPDPKAGIWAALKAAFWSSGSVVHLVGFNREVKSVYPTAAITELGLAKPSFDRLVTFISETFLRSEALGRAQPSPGLFAHSRFYPSTHKFSLLKTCNTWVAEALEAAGLPVAPGQVVTSGSLAGQIAGLGTPL